MSDEIVLWKLRDQTTSEEMDIRTPFITRERQVTRTLKFPLYVDGQIISDSELADLQLERVGYTQDQLDEIHYAALYNSNPDLETRVRQYKGYLDELSLPYDATMDDITAAIEEATAITDKAAYGAQLSAVYDAIITNLEFCGSPTPHMDACEQLVKLIQYLPEEPV